MHLTIYWRGEELFSIGLTRDPGPEPISLGDVSSLYLPVAEETEEAYEEEYEEEAQAAPAPRRRIGF